MNDTIALEILHSLLKKAGDISNKKPSDKVKILWELYKSNYGNNNSTNGSVFEEILGYTFVSEGCLPFYIQAKVAYVPNVNYDFIFYDQEKGPISISAKVSLRERWKQADLEAVALKYVHRNAISYIVSMNESEVQARNSRLSECMALYDFILASSNKFDELVNEVKARKLQLAGTIEVITSSKVIDDSTSRSRYRV